RALLAGFRHAGARARGFGFALRVLQVDALPGLGIGARQALPAFYALEIALRDLAILAPLGAVSLLLGVLLRRFLLLDHALLESGIALGEGFLRGRIAGAGAGGRALDPGLLLSRSRRAVPGVLDLAALVDAFDELAVCAPGERNHHEREYDLHEVFLSAIPFNVCTFPT